MSVGGHEGAIPVSQASWLWGKAQDGPTSSQDGSKEGMPASGNNDCWKTNGWSQATPCLSEPADVSTQVCTSAAQAEQECMYKKRMHACVPSTSADVTFGCRLSRTMALPHHRGSALMTRAWHIAGRRLPQRRRRTVHAPARRRRMQAWHVSGRWPSLANWLADSSH